MSCKKFNQCKNKEMKEMALPHNNDSLYNQRIYDNHDANRFCYQNNPVDIIEGFDHKNKKNKKNNSTKNFVKFFAFFLLLALLVKLIMDVMPKLNSPSSFYSDSCVHLNFDTTTGKLYPMKF